MFLFLIFFFIILLLLNYVIIFKSIYFFTFQAISTYSVLHNNILNNRHKKLKPLNRSTTLPTCYHIGGAHIQENLTTVEGKNVTGKEMIFGMLQYIWPKVCFIICNSAPNLFVNCFIKLKKFIE